MSQRKLAKKKPIDRRLRKDAIQVAREALMNAVAWIDAEDSTWPVVEVERALRLLKVAQDL